MVSHVVVDVVQVLRHYVADRYLVDRHAQFVHQVNGVAVGAVGCAEARHSYAQHTVTRIAEHVSRLHRHDERQCRIQTAAYTYDERLRMCMLPTAC